MSMGDEKNVRPALAGALMLAMMGCGGHPPTAPVPVGAPAVEVAADKTSADNQPPAAVFKTRPATDASGHITGPSPLEVTFNTCQSSDPDPGDQLKTTYDYDGDGKVDEAGHCRQSHVFESGSGLGCSVARVCVTDRVLMDGHTVCRSYQVCADGGGPGLPGGSTPPPSEGWVFTQANGASWTQPSGSTVRIGFQDSDDCGGGNGLRQSGTATMTLTLTEPRTLTVAMSGRVEQFGTGGLDRGAVTVDGTPLLSAGSTTAPGAPCAMTPMSLAGSVALGPGTHTIVASADTMDGLSHVGAFWSFTVSLN
jgi:hypothetical protein